jgi:hypothetical protein
MKRRAAPPPAAQHRAMLDRLRAAIAMMDAAYGPPWPRRPTRYERMMTGVKSSLTSGGLTADRLTVPTRKRGEP